MKELELNKQLSGLTESKAQQIKEIFEPMTKMIEEFEGYYNEIIKMEQSHEKCEKAKRLRVDISRVRISAEKARRQQKEEYLLAGRAIDGVSNILKYAISEKEEKLKEVETFYERMEKERVDKIRGERAAEVAKYDPIGAAVGVDFGMMPDDVWDKYVSGWKESFEACKEAERKAEEFQSILDEYKNKHKEYEESRKKIKEENERLKAENEERARIDKMREDAEKVREFAPDKEKLLDHAQILLRAKEKANSKEAINAFSSAISILENAANKMAARV